MQLIVLPNGTVHCIYGEEMDLDRLGLLKISRGSLVEPTFDGHWTADLSPVNGPSAGALSVAPRGVGIGSSLA